MGKLSKGEKKDAWFFFLATRLLLSKPVGGRFENVHTFGCVTRTGEEGLGCIFTVVVRTKHIYMAHEIKTWTYLWFCKRVLGVIHALHHRKANGIKIHANNLRCWLLFSLRKTQNDMLPIWYIKGAGRRKACILVLLWPLVPAFWTKGLHFHFAPDPANYRAINTHPAVMNWHRP